MLVKGGLDRCALHNVHWRISKTLRDISWRSWHICSNRIHEITATPATVTSNFILRFGIYLSLGLLGNHLMGVIASIRLFMIAGKLFNKAIVSILLAESHSHQSSYPTSCDSKALIKMGVPIGFCVSFQCRLYKMAYFLRTTFPNALSWKSRLILFQFH